ncbi:MAG: nicotinamide riboside transporter PnuC [Verrucomicrobiae bacterium]|nr:nicotinamide riboside transporter PnuC [Verrucomicrobiae bacterium]
MELIGTLFNLWSVCLAVRNSTWTWPVGAIGVILFAILFYQIRLYADFLEQIYFFIAGFYGWWVWARQDRPVKDVKKDRRPVNRLGWSARGIMILTIVVGTAGLTFVVVHLPRWLPAYFPEPPSFPVGDALTTVMSLVATAVMARRLLECWPLWIAVDVIGVGLYASKGIIFVALLYGVFLVLACQGLWNWRRLEQAQGAAP